jgi:hypothetical protein
MNKLIDVNSVYVLSDDVVMREIVGEAIIVPIAAGVGDMEDELYTVNEIGRAILLKLDGKRNIKEDITALLTDFEAGDETLTEDVTGFLGELYGRKIIIKAA